jgi:hypothetical protein
MLVYGKKGRISPYSIKLLTQMQLSKLLISKNKKIKFNYVSLIGILNFGDATHE